MCGIVVVLGVDASARAGRLLEGLRHRGPDSSGQSDFDGCSLAMTRLAVLDPKPRADQPMSFEGRHLVYNGELYNFRDLRTELEGAGLTFSTTGDTEVLLKALVHWGEDAMVRLRGMYAFALWDERARRVWLGRDTYGIKPLYWSPSSRGLAFASEATALAAEVGGGLRSDALREFLRFGAPISSCVYEGVVEVQPGTLTLLSPDGSAMTTRSVERSIITKDPATAAREAVQSHLVSDRPLALYLSGGFDSAMIASAAAAAGVRPTGLTLCTEGNAEDVRRAAITAQRYGLQNQAVDVPRWEVAGWIPEYLRAMDQPTIDGFNTYLVSRAAIEAGFPVALSGLGGDEVLAGYGYHRRLRRVDAASRVWRMSPPAARGPQAAAIARMVGRRPEDVAEILRAPTLPGRHRAYRSIFTATEVAQLTGADAPGSLRWTSDSAQARRRQLSQLDLETYLRPVLLRDSDVFSMAKSVEVRVPLLDEVFVASAWASERPLTKLDLARQWKDDHLVAIARSRKLTFGLPWRTWIRSVLADHVELFQTTDPWQGTVDPVAARAILRQDVDARAGNPLRPWALLVLAIWLQRPAEARQLQGVKVA
jgi:asparagine synthase (glutamine-hydrolysing)